MCYREKPGKGLRGFDFNNLDFLCGHLQYIIILSWSPRHNQMFCFSRTQSGIGVIVMFIIAIMLYIYMPVTGSQKIIFHVSLTGYSTEMGSFTINIFVFLSTFAKFPSSIFQSEIAYSQAKCCVFSISLLSLLFFSLGVFFGNTLAKWTSPSAAVYVNTFVNNIS